MSSREKLKQLVESASEPVAIKDVDGYVIRVYPDNEMPGKFYYTINHARYTGASKKTIEQALVRAEKTVAIRKVADAKRDELNRSRPDTSVDDFFKHKEKHKIPW